MQAIYICCGSLIDTQQELPIVWLPGECYKKYFELSRICSCLQTKCVSSADRYISKNADTLRYKSFINNLKNESFIIKFIMLNFLLSGIDGDILVFYNLKTNSINTKC